MGRMLTTINSMVTNQIVNMLHKPATIVRLRRHLDYKSKDGQARPVRHLRTNPNNQTLYSKVEDSQDESIAITQSNHGNSRVATATKPLLIKQTINMVKHFRSKPTMAMRATPTRISNKILNRLKSTKQNHWSKAARMTASMMTTTMIIMMKPLPTSLGFKQHAEIVRRLLIPSQNFISTFKKVAYLRLSRICNHERHVESLRTCFRALRGDLPFRKHKDSLLHLVRYERSPGK